VGSITLKIFYISCVYPVFINNSIYSSSSELKIAGHTTEFVNHVLDKVKSGIPGGGLDEI
jgi:hypothetical protein